MREIKKKHVGTENLVIKIFDEYQILECSLLLKEYYEKIKIIDNKRAHIILKFFNDMKKNLQMVNNHLEDAGVYSIVIGNSNIRGIEIESWKVISQISKYCGFIEELHFSYQIRNHYLRIDRKTKGGKKTYHTMVGAYFYDMSKIFSNLRANLQENSNMTFVIGDSAPYGIYVPVDKWLGELAIDNGFESYTFEKIRDRNIKWDNRTHKVPLKEGLLRIRG